MRLFTWYKIPQLDSADTIHQVLVYGRLEDIKKLEQKLGKDKVADYFINHPQKKYTPAMYNFIKNYILNIHQELDESRYLKNSPRNIR